MTHRLAIGIGCRKNCPANAIVALIETACKGLDGAAAPRALFSFEAKRDERGLIEAAGCLGLDLVFLPKATLEAATPSITTVSAAAQKRFGLASVAEASALAGAGAGSRLLVPRIARDGATCAIAIPAEAGA